MKKLVAQTRRAGPLRKLGALGGPNKAMDPRGPAGNLVPHFWVRPKRSSVVLQLRNAKTEVEENAVNTRQIA